MRLVGSQQQIGRLEIFHNGTWGTVCDDYFNSYAAKVACYSLGFGYFAVTIIVRPHCAEYKYLLSLVDTRDGIVL